MSNTTLMTVLPAFLQPINVCMRIANALLARDAWVRERLVEFSGASVRIVAGPLSAQASISSSGELVPSASAIVPDVTLTLPSDKLKLLPQVLREGDPAAIANLMHVEGDAGLANVVSEIAQSVRVDVEGDLARVVGDIAAVRLVSGAKRIVRSSQRSVQHLSANLSEYLGEESDFLVSRDRYALWQVRLQTLMTALDRAEHRVGHFEQQLQTSEKGR